jgi:exopolyphosphatase/guanosine-5'-triphosphate,3'-diphosphate pyrophosphatase
LLVLGQSGGLRKLNAYEPTAGEWLLVLSLRIAVILQRRRDGRATPIAVRPHPSGPAAGCRIELPAPWAAQHPLTDQSLRNEVAEWQSSGLLKAISYELT